MTLFIFGVVYRRSCLVPIMILARLEIFHPENGTARDKENVITPIKRLFKSRKMGGGGTLIPSPSS